MKKIALFALLAALLLAACDETTPTPPPDTDTDTGGADTSDCTNDYTIVEDVPVANEQVEVGSQVEKQWIVENTGTCTWGSNYIFTQIGGGFLLATEAEKRLPNTPPGDQATLSVTLDVNGEAPTGTQQEAVFQLRDPQGNGFGDEALFVLVTPVAGNIAIPTPTPRD